LCFGSDYRNQAATRNRPIPAAPCIPQRLVQPHPVELLGMHPTHNEPPVTRFCHENADCRELPGDMSLYTWKNALELQFLSPLCKLTLHDPNHLPLFNRDLCFTLLHFNVISHHAPKSHPSEAKQQTRLRESLRYSLPKQLREWRMWEHGQDIQNEIRNSWTGNSAITSRACGFRHVTCDTNN
jgi:hypothetical protein